MIRCFPAHMCACVAQLSNTCNAVAPSSAVTQQRKAHALWPGAAAHAPWCRPSSPHGPDAVVGGEEAVRDAGRHELLRRRVRMDDPAAPTHCRRRRTRTRENTHVRCSDGCVCTDTHTNSIHLSTHTQTHTHTHTQSESHWQTFR